MKSSLSIFWDGKVKQTRLSMSKSKVILVSDDLNEVWGENKPFFSRFQIDV